jgi:ornithine carbamoyltransferase
MLGSHLRVATPPGYEPNAEIFAAAQEIAQETGGSVEAMTDPREAVAGADAVYTDAWASMGQENEADTRIPVFQPYQVNEKLMAKAAPHAVFMHCLPAHRGQEATDAVMDSPQSVIFDQAEGRLHVQKAILMLLLWDGASRFPVRSAHV